MRTAWSSTETALGSAIRYALFPAQYALLATRFALLATRYALFPIRYALFTARRLFRTPRRPTGPNRLHLSLPCDFAWGHQPLRLTGPERIRPALTSPTPNRHTTARTWLFMATVLVLCAGLAAFSTRADAAAPFPATPAPATTLPTITNPKPAVPAPSDTTSAVPTHTNTTPPVPTSTNPAPPAPAPASPAPPGSAPANTAPATPVPTVPEPSAPAEPAESPSPVALPTPAAESPASIALPTPAAEPGRLAWPLTPLPHVTRTFEPPATPYGPGHRGVDLEAAAGQQVLAADRGVVVFSGQVAGHGVVALDHDGGLHTTYLPVTPAVAVGDQIYRGQVLGTVEAGHPGCPSSACLHWGARRGTEYIDPLALVGTPSRVRLKPWAESP